MTPLALPHHRAHFFRRSGRGWIHLVALALVASLVGVAAVTAEAAEPTLLQVGPTRPYTTIAAAAAAAPDNSIVEIDAGTYTGDVAEWRQDNITIRGVGGPVILEAAGAYVDGMGIWKLHGGRFRVEGITFRDADVPDNNGAGIRLVDGDLTVVNCRFLHNEDGILTGNFATTRLTIENSEFGDSIGGNGFAHLIYVGRIGYFKVTGSYFHNARQGHLLKTRAQVSIITANRLIDGSDPASSLASYELDIPDGGQAVVVGNIIHQSAYSLNTWVVAYGEENTGIWPVNRLYFAYNTVVNDRSTTSPFMMTRPGLGENVLLYNNLLASNLHLDAVQPNIASQGGNHVFEAGDLNADYSPTAATEAALAGTVTNNLDSLLAPALADQGISLVPTLQPNATSGTTARAATTVPGALQASPATPPANDLAALLARVMEMIRRVIAQILAIFGR
jgi:hypothetical protein